MGVRGIAAQPGSPGRPVPCAFGARARPGWAAGAPPSLHPDGCPVSPSQAQARAQLLSPWQAQLPAACRAWPGAVTEAPSVGQVNHTHPGPEGCWHGSPKQGCPGVRIPVVAMDTASESQNLRLREGVDPPAPGVGGKGSWGLRVVLVSGSRRTPTFTNPMLWAITRAHVCLCVCGCVCISGRVNVCVSSCVAFCSLAAPRFASTAQIQRSLRPALCAEGVRLSYATWEAQGPGRAASGRTRAASSPSAQPKPGLVPSRRECVHTPTSWEAEAPVQAPYLGVSPFPLFSIHREADGEGRWMNTGRLAAAQVCGRKGTREPGTVPRATFKGQAEYPQPSATSSEFPDPDGTPQPGHGLRTQPPR